MNDRNRVVLEFYSTAEADSFLAEVRDRGTITSAVHEESYVVRDAELYRPRTVNTVTGNAVNAVQVRLP